MKNDTVSKSWFCVFNNPEEHGFEGTPQEIVNKIIELWTENNPQRTCAVTYCISAEGLKHCHAVLEDTKAMRFSAVKKIFPAMHIDVTKGNKEQAENYINKRPPFDEQGEQIIYMDRHGEIKGRQGQRKDLDIIEELIRLGMTPNEIFNTSITYRHYDKIVKDAYYAKRLAETPIMRDISVYWHVGESGTGKSFVEVKLAEIHGEQHIYKVSDTENGFIDKYNGERILLIDEFRGQIKYPVLLTMLDKYKNQIHARYTNVYGLWTEVHIMSVFPPEKLYEHMINENKSIDTYEQLRRRITHMVYHYKDNDEYFEFEIPMGKYIDYEHLKRLAKNPNFHTEPITTGITEDMIQCEITNEPTPFDDG